MKPTGCEIIVIIVLILGLFAAQHYLRNHPSIMRKLSHFTFGLPNPLELY